MPDHNDNHLSRSKLPDEIIARIIEDEGLKDPHGMIELINRHRVTVWLFQTDERMGAVREWAAQIDQSEFWLGCNEIKETLISSLKEQGLDDELIKENQSIGDDYFHRSRGSITSDLANLPCKTCKKMG